MPDTFVSAHTIATPHASERGEHPPRTSRRLPHMVLLLHRSLQNTVCANSRARRCECPYLICCSASPARISTLSLWAKPDPVSVCRPENWYFLVRQICTMGR